VVEHKDVLAAVAKGRDDVPLDPMVVGHRVAPSFVATSGFIALADLVDANGSGSWVPERP
jgi:hypothetical protein